MICDLGVVLSGEVEYVRDDERGYEEGEEEWGVLWIRVFEKLVEMYV